MKSYQEVVEERYNKAEKEAHIYNTMYSMINSIGFYGAEIQKRAFHDCFNFFRSQGMDISQAKILDIGCGKGFVTRFFAELTQNPSNIYGSDLSTYRIDEAKKLNSSINYYVDDLVEPQVSLSGYDVISAVDVFMHLPTKEEILIAMKHIHSGLTSEGYFLWYDAFAKDHFKTTEDQDHSGFHPSQMLGLAKEAGFVPVFRKSLFKRVLWKYHSLYLIQRLPKFLVKSCEYFFPGSPGNMLIIFKKANS